MQTHIHPKSRDREANTEGEGGGDSPVKPLEPMARSLRVWYSTEAWQQGVQGVQSGGFDSLGAAVQQRQHSPEALRRMQSARERSEKRRQVSCQQITANLGATCTRFSCRRQCVQTLDTMIGWLTKGGANLILDHRALSQESRKVFDKEVGKPTEQKSSNSTRRLVFLQVLRGDGSCQRRGSSSFERWKLAQSRTRPCCAGS